MHMFMELRSYTFVVTMISPLFSARSLIKLLLLCSPSAHFCSPLLPERLVSHHVGRPSRSGPVLDPGVPFCPLAFQYYLRSQLGSSDRQGSGRRAPEWTSSNLKWPPEMLKHVLL